MKLAPSEIKSDRMIIQVVAGAYRLVIFFVLVRRPVTGPEFLNNQHSSALSGELSESMF